MRTLVMARRDAAGSWCRLATELRRCGRDVRVVTFENPSELRWPTDVAEIYDGGQELCTLIARADAFHFVDLLPEEIGLLDGAAHARIADGAPVVLQCDAMPSPARAREILAASAKNGWPIVTTRPLAKLLPGAEFMPPFVPWWRAPFIPQATGTRPRVRKSERIVFASSTRPLRERPRLEALVERAEAAAREAADVRVEVLCGKPHAQILQRQRRSHLVLCASAGGLGRSGLEALAQGLTVVADLDAAAWESWATLAGSLPPVVPSSSLSERVHALAYDQGPDARRIAWARSVLDPNRWLRACDRWWTPAVRVPRAA
jgi:hypothetical protein